MPSFRDSAAEPRGTWASAAVPLDVSQARALVESRPPELAYDDPSAGAWYGYGEARVLEGELADVDHAQRALGPDEVWFATFAFDPARSWPGFPSARLVLPRTLVHIGADRAYVLGFDGQAPRTSEEPARLESLEAESEPDDWRRGVEEILGAIRAGHLHKAVLARTLRARLSRPPDRAALLARLRRQQPGCAVFHFGDGERAFVGATPEILFRRTGERLETMALAGSRPRDPARDAELTEQLVADPKERREHALVLDAIRDALAPHAVELHAAATSVRTLATLLHLETRVSAQLRPGTSTRALLEALHPTPAVCGTPREPARALLARVEPFDRGLYAGPVGVLGRDFCHLSVALRSMLLEGSSARLFVGAGIVEGSEAEREWLETDAKSRAMRRALEDA